MDNDSSLSSNKSCKGSKTLANKYSLNANTTKEYYILVYIKNINGVQTDTGSFTGTITFTSNDGNEVKARFNDDPALTTLTNLGLSVDTSHTPDFTTVSGNSGAKIDFNSGETLATGLGDGTNGIYKSEDDLGVSYYFRGDIHNNYVYFAKNWWQIIRINGDGTIRMIYTSNPNDENSEPYIGRSGYNSNDNDNAYVGYMYGTVGSSTYEATHTNTNNSTIKTVVDEWYKNNLSSYSTYIADAIYCNDREVVAADFAFNNHTYSCVGDGSGTNQSAYASYKRNHLEHSPTLKCKNNNDRFTISSTLGNGALTYPIGLITTDEIVMSGGSIMNTSSLVGVLNQKHYLVNGNEEIWTMTPLVNVQKTSIVEVSMMGMVADADIALSSAFYIRPVISLNADAITGGDGTVSNPFYVNE